jgi:hypothetical protein
MGGGGLQGVHGSIAFYVKGTLNLILNIINSVNI